MKLSGFFAFLCILAPVYVNTLLGVIYFDYQASDCYRDAKADKVKLCTINTIECYSLSK